MVNACMVQAQKHQLEEEIDSALEITDSNCAIKRLNQILKPLTLSHYNCLQLIWMRDQRYFESQQNQREISEIEEAEEYVKDHKFNGKSLSERFQEYYKSAYVDHVSKCPALNQSDLDKEQKEFIQRFQ